MLLEDIIILWCLFMLALACPISFVAVLYEKAAAKRRRKRRRGEAPPPDDAPGRIKSSPIRGYDSEDLLREDLRLLRLADAPDPSRATAFPAPGGAQDGRVCAALARRAAADPPN
ncbi:MAG TPA: hypothetical protein VNN77_05790 [candidate division Zixibacteria bacterium]|nr:hypothetical protein [candidate division Zixibacteria bacterium]